MSLNTLAQQSIERIQKEKRSAVEGVTVPTQENVLSAIAKYIPVEVITIFLAGLSLLHPSPVVGWLTPTSLFWTLFLFTPLCLWMIFVAKFRSQDANKAWPQLIDYPWWRMVASMVAFFVWAHAVPENGM